MQTVIYFHSVDYQIWAKLLQHLDEVALPGGRLNCPSCCVGQQCRHHGMHICVAGEKLAALLFLRHRWGAAHTKGEVRVLSHPRDCLGLTPAVKQFPGDRLVYCTYCPIAHCLSRALTRQVSHYGDSNPSLLDGTIRSFAF